MKVVNSQLMGSLKARACRTVVAWRIERMDGVVYGFSSGDKTFTYDGLLYEPTNGFSGTAAASKNNMSVDNVSALGMLTAQITEQDLKTGKFDNASIKIFWIDPYHPEYGIVPIRGGKIGELTVKNNQFEAEMRAVMQALQQPFGRVYTLECSATLGDAACGVQMTPAVWSAGLVAAVVQVHDARIGTIVKPTVYNGWWYKCTTAGTTGVTEPAWPTSAGATVNDNGVVWTTFMARKMRGTVTAAAGRVTFYDTGMTAPALYFQYGYVEWLTGDNAGFKSEIREYVTSPRPGFRVLEQCPYRIKIGDTYEATMGCPHTRTACSVTFDNIWNMQAFPDMPTEDKALSTPSVKQGTQTQDDGGKG